MGNVSDMTSREIMYMIIIFVVINVIVCFVVDDLKY
jgi:hypothetical protein